MKQLKAKVLKRFLKDIPKHKLKIHLFLDNIQYARNVAEIFRVCDASNVEKIYIYGITKSPPFGKELQKVSRKKEYRISWEIVNNEMKLFKRLKKDNFDIIALEITDESIDIRDYKINNKNLLVIVGNEVNGISKRILKYADKSIMIPMYGKGASMNVTVSFSILIYYLILNHDQS